MTCVVSSLAGALTASSVSAGQAQAERLRFGSEVVSQGATAGGTPVPATSGDPSPGEAADLAKQLSNPVASLISLPLQLNWDTGLGPNGTDRYVLNVQPVIPFELNSNWNMISRTIVPLVDLESPAPGIGGAQGVGDIIQSLFFSPVAPVSGWIIGFGPVFLLPTATQDAFAGKQFGAGPTAVALRQVGGWTYGALANHIWGLTDPEGDRDKVNGTFLQPFLTYTTADAWTFALNTESSYDWKTDEWTVPINTSVSKLVHFGEQPVSFQLGYRHYADAPDGGPDWGLRFAVTFLFPKN